MKKIISVMLVMIMVFGTGAVAFAENQISVPEGYIGIYTAEDLYNIRNNLSGKYILMNDIDLSFYENWEPIGTLEEPFTGELDGNGYHISSLKITGEYNDDSAYNIGLFGFTRNAKFADIIVVNAEINVLCTASTTVKCRLGILIGNAYGTNLDNCVVGGYVSAKGFSTTEIGGISGRAAGISWFNLCVNYAGVKVDVDSDADAIYAAGLSGVGSVIKDKCCNFGNIKVVCDDINSNCKIKAGGIDGFGFEGSRLNDCYSRGEIIITDANSKTYVGGLSGDSYITKNSYSSTSIVLPENFSGFAGGISGSIGQGGYAFIGDWPSVENVYCLENELPVGCSFGVHPDNMTEAEMDNVFVNANKLSEEEMKKESTFVDFDFKDIWTMEENGYPVLKNQPTIEINKEVELNVGETYFAGSQYIDWSTTNPDVATLNENGEIVAVGTGEGSVVIEYLYGYKCEYSIKTSDDNTIKTNKSFILKMEEWLRKAKKFVTNLVNEIAKLLKTVYEKVICV